MTPEEDAQTAALQTYFEDNTPAGYGASFRAGWREGRIYEAGSCTHGGDYIELRGALTQIVSAFIGGIYCTNCGESLDDGCLSECVIGMGRKALEG